MGEEYKERVWKLSLPQCISIPRQNISFCKIWRYVRTCVRRILVDFISLPSAFIFSGLFGLIATILAYKIK